MIIVCFQENTLVVCTRRALYCRFSFIETSIEMSLMNEERQFLMPSGNLATMAILAMLECVLKFYKDWFSY